MHPLHLNNLINNVQEVNQLMLIHIEIAGKNAGRKNPRIQTLNKSSIVLLTACWEAYIEDLARDAFEFLINNCKTHDNIPSSVLVKASRKLKEDKNHTTIWSLAGDGWRNILKKHGSDIINKKIDYFHVPRPDNIDKLYEDLLGLKNITSKWKWQKMSNTNAIEKLNKFIDLRGAIAHRIQTNKNIWKKDVSEYRRLLIPLAVITHNRINDFLEKKTGQKAWIQVKTGKIR